MKEYDYIFAGFGLSGMTLLNELLKNEDSRKKRILILDLDRKQSNDRTWSFWHKEDFEFANLAKKTWNQGVFKCIDGTQIIFNQEDYQYSTIQGIDFYKAMFDRFSNYQNLDFRWEKILKVSPEGIVHTEENTYTGGFVFNSFFLKEDFEKIKRNYFVWQHFFGVRIRTKEKIFNPQQFVLMDYSQTHEKRTNFFYVLPFSENEALVEFTEFSNHQYTHSQYDKLVRDYISETLKIEDYEVEEEELNAIPMTDYQIKTVLSHKVINIGSMAGYVKPSSGYAFTRTVERNKILAKHILENKSITENTLSSSKVYKAFDNAVLYLISTEKVHGGLIFGNMFQKMSAGFIYRFLDEKIGAIGLFKVMLSAPKKWEFIKYFLKYRGK